MDPDCIRNLIILVLLLALSAFFSASETAFSSMSRVRIKTLAADGDKKAARALGLLDRYDQLLSTILIGNNLVNIAASALATVTAAMLSNSNWAITVSTAILTVAILIFGEITPKSLAKDSAERFGMAVAPVLWVFFFLFYPLNIVFLGWKKFLGKVFKPAETESEIEDELLTIVEEAEDQGGLDANESELIRNAIEFNETEAIDIRTPRVDVVAVEIGDSHEKVLERFFESGYSRLPIYKETIDNIVGVLNQKDFTNPANAGKSLAEIMTEPVFIIPTLPIAQLLTLLQRKKSHLAVIVDEYGGTDGIVTLEDVIEELVGEIWDEHDEVVEEICKKSDTEYDVLCSAALTDMFETLDLPLEEEDEEFPTVGGWVADKLGDIPAVGDSFTSGRLQITVTRCEGRHAVEIHAVLLPPAEEEE